MRISPRRPVTRIAVLALAVAAASTGTALPAGAAPAAEKVTFSAQMHGDGTPQQFRTTGADGQIQYGNGHLVGSTTIDDDAVAVDLLAQITYTRGAGPFTGFWTLTYPSGDVLSLTYRGTTTVDAGTTTIHGRLGVLGGTGALADVRGTGRVTGTRTAALGGDVTYDFALTLRGLP